MIIVKNSYGLSTAIDPKICNDPELLNQFRGSSLDRISNYLKSSRHKLTLEEYDEKISKKIPKLRSMSPRTKSKIKKKILAFGRFYKKLSFLTLTFTNEVTDKKAVRILHEFLDNVGKRNPGFQYLWVAEKQILNQLFKNNIHFHIINNQYWKIEKWWQYWLDLQEKHGIIPRDPNFRPSSAFDVKCIRSNNIRGVTKYLTKYVTKNVGEFDCQVWNCSKKISWLHTDFYTGIEIVRSFERLERADILGGKMKTYPMPFCNVHIVPLNNVTLPFYRKIEAANQVIWNLDKPE